MLPTRWTTHLLSAALSSSFAGLLASIAGAQLLSHDGFGNGPRVDLAGSTGGTGWTSAWLAAGTDSTGIGGSGLQYSGLATTVGAAVTPTAGGVWPNSSYQRAFQAPPAGTGTIYVSFLLRDDAAYGSWAGLSFGQYPYEMTVGVPPGYYAYGLMMSQGLGDVTSKPLIQGETTLVVVKISQNTAGSGITYRMYLDPVIGTPEPSFPAASFALGPISALPTYVTIDNGTGFTTDELRIGTTWSSVLPPQVSTWTDLGFAKPGINGAPHLVGSGPLSANSSNSVTLTDARPMARAWLVVGANIVNRPFLGGTLVPQPTSLLPLTTDAAGSASVHATWPSGLSPGLPIRFQCWIQDPAATFGFSASNGLQGLSQ